MVKSVNEMIKAKRGVWKSPNPKLKPLHFVYICTNLVRIDGKKYYAASFGFYVDKTSMMQLDFISESNKFGEGTIVGVGGINPKYGKYQAIKINDFEFNKFMYMLQVGLNKSGKKALQESAAEKIFMAQAIVSIFTLFFIFAYFFKVWKIKSAELEVERLERDMTEKMFKNQDKNDSAFDAYISLITSIEGLLKSENRFGLLIYGPPGTGKTYIVRRTLYFNHVKYVFKKGSTGSDVAQGLMKIFFDNRDKLLVLDDFDDALIQPGARNMLKAATDTYPKRIISVPRAETTGQYDVANIPEEFVFKGKIIVITNLDEKDIEPALLSRMNAQEVKFTNEEMVQLLEKMIKNLSPEIDMSIKREVIKYLKEVKTKHPRYKIDFRTFKTVLDLRIMYPNNWKQLFEKTIR